jgi:serine/threonine protein kinase
MGAVFSAFDRNRDEDVAIKVLLPELSRDEVAAERFLNEARLSSQLSHPNIINVFDVQSDNGAIFLTMELLQGMTLRDQIELHRVRGEDFTIEEVTGIAKPLCDALVHAHTQTVHRDIKPENIWVCDDGTVKLMDFGIARMLRVSQMTQTAMSLGTAYYMAPEQISQSKDVDGRADQFALAAVLYELLTGNVPAGKIKSARSVRKEVPMGMSRALDKALESSPEDRFISMDTFYQALTRRGPTLELGLSARLVASVVVFVIGIGVTYPFWKDTVADAFPNIFRDMELVAKVEDTRGKVAVLDLQWDKLQEYTDAATRESAAEALKAFQQGDQEFANKNDQEALNAFETAVNEYTPLIIKAQKLVQIEAELRQEFVTLAKRLTSRRRHCVRHEVRKNQPS